MSPGDLAVIIPAKNEAARIAATVTAASKLAGADLVIVVDDGSDDQTGSRAEAAGARVVRHPRNRGKAAAMQTGAAEVSRLESAAPGAGPRHLLFLDADLEDSAAHAGPLAGPVRDGRADATIAYFASRVRRGGFGLVVGTAGAGI